MKSANVNRDWKRAISVCLRAAAGLISGCSREPELAKQEHFRRAKEFALKLSSTFKGAAEARRLLGTLK